MLTSCHICERENLRRAGGVGGSNRRFKKGGPAGKLEGSSKTSFRQDEKTLKGAREKQQNAVSLKARLRPKKWFVTHRERAKSG
jgi:hypothetical protein